MITFTFFGAWIMDALSSAYAAIRTEYKTIAANETVVEMCQVIKATHVNQYDILQSGQLLKWVDICACLAAEKLAGCPCVTVSVDDLFLKNNVKLGNILNIKAKVNRSFKTSMEVGVFVTSENIQKDDYSIFQICEAYLTFVALDQNGNKVILPQLECITKQDKFEYFLAEERKKIRISHSHTLVRLLQNISSSAHIHHHRSITDDHTLYSCDTRVESIELVLPSYANHHGNTFGGQVMEWVETVGSVAALKLCKSKPVLRSVDMVHFRGPSFVGDRVVLSAIVNGVFKNSFEVGVRVEAYNCKSGKIGCKRHINSAFLSYEVETDLPTFLPDTPDAKRRYKEAIARRKIRLDKRYILSSKRQDNLSVAIDDDNWQHIRLSGISTLMLLCNHKEWTIVSEKDNLTLSTLERNGMLLFKVSKVFSRSQISCEHAFNVLKQITNRVKWDPLFISSKLVKEFTDEDSVYYNVMKPFSDISTKNNGFILLVSCRSPSKQNNRYLISMRSVKYEEEEIDITGVTLCEINCAGFAIEITAEGDTEISYYNETNPQLVSYITSDIAGCSTLYSKIYESMEQYILCQLN